MPDIVIKAENLGKKYTIGHQSEKGSYVALRDVLMKNARNLWSKTRDLLQGKPIIQGDTHEEVWALKDVNFEIERGQAVGIIGRNGAGKSTLLKVLSRITEPSAGRVTIKGRVASLLEVGTGFHPELTGRENIYLNGAILGMTRGEIKRKFDEIVAFAEVEKFLDTPVKRYSSGMYVRLAFAVAAHLEPEILLVDEVLAVGDTAFQKKCLGKMRNVSKGGRTVLFVSHNMGAIRQLVDRCILLEGGRIDFIGNKDECIDRYIKTSLIETGSRQRFSENIPTKNSPVVIKEVALKDKNGEYTDVFSVGAPWRLELKLQALSVNTKFQASMQILNENGIPIYHLVCRDSGQEYFITDRKAILKVILPKLMLYPGQYSVNIVLLHPGWSSIAFHKIDSAISFYIDQSGGHEIVRPLGKGMAVVHKKAIWELQTNQK